MKKTHSIIALLMALMCFLSACTASPRGGNTNGGTNISDGISTSSEQRVTDSGFINDTVYDGYAYWQRENQIRLLTDFSFEVASHKEIAQETTKELKLSKKQLQTIEELKTGIQDYFQEMYGIDVSDRLEKQQVCGFKLKSNGDNTMTMGYVDTSSPDVLHINEMVLKGEYKYLFKTVYVHETLHQIGFRPVGERYVLLEGITDALTDLIMLYMGETPELTPTYGQMRAFGYQILAADHDVVGIYLNNDGYNIFGRVSQVLSKVKQPYCKDANIGERLRELTEHIYYYELGQAYSMNDPYVYAFEAQEIVRAYCQAFNPTEETIDYIRCHYLVLDIEEKEIGGSQVGEYYFK